MPVLPKKKPAADNASMKPDNLAIAYNMRKQTGRSASSMAMPEHEDHYSSIADAILAKKKQHMSEGGMVDLNENAEEGPADLDWANEAAAKKELYDDDQMSDQPMDSNEHGDDIDSDKHDMVSQIRRKMKSKM